MTLNSRQTHAHSGTKPARVGPAINRRAPRLDYVVRPHDDNPLVATSAAFKMLAEQTRLRKQRERLDAAYAGGLILLMFHQAPWLQSCSFVLRASSEYNDEGGYSRSIRLSDVTEVVRVPGVEPSPDLCEGGIFSNDAANEWIEDFFDYDAASLYEVFQADEVLDDLHLSCDRRALADALRQLEQDGKASGTLAFVALWPEEAQRVRGR